MRILSRSGRAVHLGGIRPHRVHPITKGKHMYAASHQTGHGFFIRVLRGLHVRFSHWGALRRQRRHLAAMDDYLLRDIGLTRQDIAEAFDGAAWDAPSHWRG